MNINWQLIMEWGVRAAVRAVKTAAQTAIAVIPTSAVTIGEVDPVMVAGAAALGGVMSLLTSLAGLPEVEGGESVAKLAKKA